MSYNQSLISSSNYPLMSQSQWEEAPFNQPAVSIRKFDVFCSQTLSKTVSISTDDYQPEYDEEERRICANTEDTNWKKAFQDSGAHTPLQLLSLFKDFLKTNLENGIVYKTPAFTRLLVEECGGWTEDELEVMEE